MSCMPVITNKELSINDSVYCIEQIVPNEERGNFSIQCFQNFSGLNCKHMMHVINFSLRYSFSLYKNTVPE